MKNNKKGFTLLELMVATAIILIVISGLLFTFIHCLMINEASNNMVIAANDAQYVMEDIRSLPFSGLDNIENYNWTFVNLNNEAITAAKANCGQCSSILKQIDVTVSWNERQRQRSFQLSTLIVRQSGS